MFNQREVGSFQEPNLYDPNGCVRYTVTRHPDKASLRMGLFPSAISSMAGLEAVEGRIRQELKEIGINFQRKAKDTNSRKSILIPSFLIRLVDRGKFENDQADPRSNLNEFNWGIYDLTIRGIEHHRFLVFKNPPPDVKVENEERHRYVYVIDLDDFRKSYQSYYEAKLRKFEELVVRLGRVRGVMSTATQNLALHKGEILVPDFIRTFSPIEQGKQIDEIALFLKLVEDYGSNDQRKTTREYFKSMAEGKTLDSFDKDITANIGAYLLHMRDCHGNPIAVQDRARFLIETTRKINTASTDKRPLPLYKFFKGFKPQEKEQLRKLFADPSSYNTRLIDGQISEEDADTTSYYSMGNIANYVFTSRDPDELIGKCSLSFRHSLALLTLINEEGSSRLDTFLDGPARDVIKIIVEEQRDVSFKDLDDFIADLLEEKGIHEDSYIGPFISARLSRRLYNEVRGILVILTLVQAKRILLTKSQADGINAGIMPKSLKDAVDVVSAEFSMKGSEAVKRSSKLKRKRLFMSRFLDANGLSQRVTIDLLDGYKGKEISVKEVRSDSDNHNTISFYAYVCSSRGKGGLDTSSPTWKLYQEVFGRS